MTLAGCAYVRTVQDMTKTCPICDTLTEDQLREFNTPTITKSGHNRYPSVNWLHERGVMTDYTTVQKHRQRCDVSVPETPVIDPANKDHRPWVETDAEGADVCSGAVTEPVHWADVFDRFGLDPAEYEIVDDTVRMSAWDAQTKNGIQTLYSYRARFRLRTAPALTAADIDRLRSIALSGDTSAEKPTGEGTLVVALADLQLGKSEGGGVEATVRRFRESLDRITHHANSLVDEGVIGRILLAQMGDPTEGCSGNYTSQAFTVQLNQRQQLNLALDLLTVAIKELAEIAPVDFLTVHSNHGEWTRNGGQKPITGDSDTVDGFLADTLARVFTDRDRVVFHTPHDQSVMTLTTAGVPIAFSHGHKATGGMEKWIAGQTQRLVYRHGLAPRVWVTAHFHHLRSQDLGAYSWFQCPSLDGGSKWFEDSAGLWSTPGVLTFVATTDSPVGWHSMQVL